MERFGASANNLHICFDTLKLDGWWWANRWLFMWKQIVHLLSWTSRMHVRDVGTYDVWCVSQHMSRSTNLCGAVEMISSGINAHTPTSWVSWLSMCAHNQYDQCSCQNVFSLYWCCARQTTVKQFCNHNNLQPAVTVCYDCLVLWCLYILPLFNQIFCFTDDFTWLQHVDHV